MENENKNIDLIDMFIENQRKSKMWAIISVCLFLVMAALVLVFSKKLSETKLKLVDCNVELVSAYKSLELVKDSIQRAKDSVVQVNFSLENTKNNVDSLESVNDTLTVLLNKTQEEFIKINTATAVKRINELYRDAFPGQEKKVSDDISKSIIRTNEIKPDVAATRVIYIQYMPAYKELCSKIRNQLVKNPIYTIESPQQVLRTTFNPTVKYFHDEDKQTADNITRELNQSFGSELKKPFISQKIGLKTPLHQLEIWIGLYEQKQLDQQKEFYKLLQDTVKFRNLIEKKWQRVN